MNACKMNVLIHQEISNFPLWCKHEWDESQEYTVKTLKILNTMKHIPPYFVFYLFTSNVLSYICICFIFANIDCYLGGVSVQDKNVCNFMFLYWWCDN